MTLRTRAPRLVAAWMGLCLGTACSTLEPAEELDEATVETAKQALSGSGNEVRPLSKASVPRQVGGDIQDKAVAVGLGKIFFWDVQVGGDGQVACATCHFLAGTDNRRVNTLSPGPDGLFQSGGVNAACQPFNGSSIANDDLVGSQGVVGAIFEGIDPNPANAADRCTPDSASPPFFACRRVTGRNTPTTIGSVFNRENFWDGRANHLFNGINPFGATGNAGLPTAAGGDFAGSGTGSRSKVDNASLASLAMKATHSLGSQAVGPPNNEVEMSCLGRTFNGEDSLGAKLLARPPLQFQVVDPKDSVLGSYSASPAPGLRCGTVPCTYQQIIDAAFVPAVAADAQNQFSRIWGQAVQAYVATLVPDQTPLDRYLSGNRKALTRTQERGLNTFTGKGQCSRCHAGVELTDASVSFAQSKGLKNEDKGDQGFHNIGVRPTGEDLGRAGLGPLGVSFSVSGAAADRGAFKTPGLRNVKLTAPYFHNGGKATLGEVVDFYSRGGDFPNPEKAKRIKRLGLSSRDQAELVDFLANGLTDCRVERERAPFDHPSLAIPNGAFLPAVGAGGNGPCP